MEKTALLNSIYTELLRYKTTQCQLKHEQVKEVISDAVMGDEGPQDRIVRTGFCDSAFRKWELGCAHTPAAMHNFKTLVGNFAGAADLDASNLPLQNMDDVICQIFLLDHEKGALEKQYSFLKLRNGSPEEIAATQDKLKTAIAHHTVLINQLEQLRASVLAKLAAIISS